MARKLIGIKELLPGMYIDEIKCGMRERMRIGETKDFMISSKNEIALIAKQGIQHVYIDPEKGLDVYEGSEEDELAQVESEAFREPRSLEEELRDAKVILDKASNTLKDAINEIRSGGKITMDPVKLLLEEIYNSVNENKDAIVTVCRKKKKDGYMLEHSVSHCALMMAIGQTMGVAKDELLDLGLGGLFHDIGKIRIPEGILKKPGKLTPEELDVIKKHPLWGGEIMIASGNFPEKAISIAMEHHERYDGTGYPYQLAGNDISLVGQMASIADVYDASISIRPYGTAGDPCLVIKNLFQEAGKLFHMDMVQQFIKTIGIYPVGTLARLESDKLGIVIKQNKNLTQPVVRVVYDLKNNSYMPPKDIDLSHAGGRGDKVVEAESPEKWKIYPGRFMFSE
ncbi:MAG: HD-GYP domain-containing protein [Nitrosomonadales bacterium]|nr:HD-GYP domain-containing protein [Nitrosomonadales bacterium]